MKDKILKTRNLNVYFDDVHAIKNVSIEIYENEVTSITGPSGCGKTTLLRALNRMTDLTPESRIEGEVLYRGNNIYSPEMDVISLRENIGMVFQAPNPFPKSIYENVAYGPKSTE